jgi:hypothetical protein
MATILLYNGQEFPNYVFTDKVKTYLFVDFDIVFVDQDFWKILRDYLESKKITSIVIQNVDPDYYFNEIIKTNNLPGAFMELARNENLEGYFDFKANLHMLTNKAIIFSEEKDEFCIVLDRSYSIGIIGFTSKDHIAGFNEYVIRDILDYLKINFGGNELPSSLKAGLHKNWSL